MSDFRLALWPCFTIEEKFPVLLSRRLYSSKNRFDSPGKEENYCLSKEKTQSSRPNFPEYCFSAKLYN